MEIMWQHIIIAMCCHIVCTLTIKGVNPNRDRGAGGHLSTWPASRHQSAGARDEQQLENLKLCQPPSNWGVGGSRSHLPGSSRWALSQYQPNILISLLITQVISADEANTACLETSQLFPRFSRSCCLTVRGGWTETWRLSIQEGTDCLTIWD